MGIDPLVGNKNWSQLGHKDHVRSLSLVTIILGFSDFSLSPKEASVAISSNSYPGQENTGIPIFLNSSFIIFLAWNLILFDANSCIAFSKSSGLVLGSAFISSIVFSVMNFLEPLYFT